MSVVDTLFILFKLDSSGVKKGKKEVDSAIDQIEGKFVNLGKKVTGIFAGLFTVGSAIAGAKSAFQYVDSLGELSEALNVNVGELDAWTKAAELSGSSSEEFQNTVKGMTTELTNFATKGKSATLPFFQQLGVSMTDSRGKARDFLEILPELASKFEKLSKAESFGIGQKLGLDTGTILLLQKGRREVEAVIKQQKELGTVTAKDVEISKQFNDQLNKTKLGFRSLFTEGNSFVLPILQKILSKFDELISFFKKHTDLAKGFFIAFGTVAVLWLGKIAIASIAAFWPFYLVTGIIAALIAIFALLYEDISAFLNGQNSLLGDIVKKYPIVGDIVHFLIDTFKTWWEIMKGLLVLIIRLFTDPIGVFEQFRDELLAGFVAILDKFPLLKLAITGMSDAFAIAGKFIMGIWDGIIAVIKSAIGVVTGAVDKVAAAYGKVKGFFGLNDAEVKQTVITGNAIAGTANANAVNATSANAILAGNSIANQSTSVQTGDINIQTQATDANGIASDIGKTLDAHLRQANNTFDDGVIA